MPKLSEIIIVSHLKCEVVRTERVIIIPFFTLINSNLSKLIYNFLSTIRPLRKIKSDKFERNKKDSLHPILDHLASICSTRAQQPPRGLLDFVPSLLQTIIKNNKKNSKLWCPHYKWILHEIQTPLARGQSKRPARAEDTPLCLFRINHFVSFHV